MSRGRPLIAGVITVALLAVAAAAVPDGFALARRAASARQLLPGGSPLAPYVLIALGLLAVGAALYGMVVLAGTDSRIRTIKRTPTWLQLVIFLMALFLAARLAELFERDGPTEDGPISRPPVADAPADVGGPSSAALAVTLLLAAATVGSLGVVVALARREREGSTAEDADEDFVAELDDGIERLELGEDPRATVIRCYAGMERALKRSGLPRRPSDTPYEFLARALGERRVSGDSARALTELFEQARFSTHDIDEVMRTRALNALRTVRSELLPGQP